MLSTLWRAALAAADHRKAMRLLTDRPGLDVAFITNIRDEAERRRFFPAGSPAHRHASGPRIYLGDVAGQVRGIPFTAAQMVDREERKRAKKVFIDAVAWSQDQGARVVLLAASTKRLFGRDGAELRERFPELLFTIGDNGTAHLLCHDVARAIRRAGLLRPRILVIGAYGILGSAVSRELQRQRHDVVGYGVNAGLLSRFWAETGIQVTSDLEHAGHFDVVVACTHSEESKLDPAAVDHLRRPHRRLLVVDVAEPANLDAETLARCAGKVVRQDAGNGHSPHLKYVLGPLSWNKLHLSQGTVFGCFAEAMSLFHAVYREHNPSALTRDWFEVTDGNMALVREAFQSLDLGLPAPHCFGRLVTDFGLEQMPAGGACMSDAGLGAASST